MRKSFIVFAAIIIILLLLRIIPFGNPFVIRDDTYYIPIPIERINLSEIDISNNRLVISIYNISISRYANTSSMNPLITENAKGITIVPKSTDEVRIGDIITYEQNSILIVHRVVDIGTDEDGWYCITKGDNTQQSDGKIRFEQIKSILIGILY